MIQIPCIDRPTLLKLRDGALPALEAEAVRSHLEFCPSCGALAGELDELSGAMARFAATRAAGACPDALVLASYAEGSLVGGERSDCEAHLAICGSCTADLAALGRELAGLETQPGINTPAWALERARALVGPGPAVAEPRVAEARAPVWAPRAAAPAATGGSWTQMLARLRAASWPAAAVASLALIVLVQLPDPGIMGSAERGQRPSAKAPAITLTAPVDGMNLIMSRGLLAWEPVAGADTYAVTVVDAGGGWVWEAETSRSQVALPPGLRLEPGESYSWWVKTVLDSGEQVESTPGRFTVAQ